MTRPRLVLLGVTAVGLAALLFLVVVPDGRSDDVSVDAGRVTTATPAADLAHIELGTFQGGSVRFGAFSAGRPLVVNFFASWCGPCVREMPDFEAVHGRRAADVGFLGVNLQDSSDAAAELVALTGVTYDVVRDERGELFRAVRGFSMPTTVFLSADGTVAEVHGGELSQRALEARIDRLLGR